MPRPNQNDGRKRILNPASGNMVLADDVTGLRIRYQLALKTDCAKEALKAFPHKRGLFIHPTSKRKLKRNQQRALSYIVPQLENCTSPSQFTSLLASLASLFPRFSSKEKTIPSPPTPPPPSLPSSSVIVKTPVPALTLSKLKQTARKQSYNATQLSQVFSNVDSREIDKLIRKTPIFKTRQAAITFLTELQGLSSTLAGKEEKKQQQQQSSGGIIETLLSVLPSTSSSSSETFQPNVMYVSNLDGNPTLTIVRFGEFESAYYQVLEPAVDGHQSFTRMHVRKSSDLSTDVSTQTQNQLQNEQFHY